MVIGGREAKASLENTRAADHPFDVACAALVLT